MAPSSFSLRWWLSLVVLVLGLAGCGDDPPETIVPDKDLPDATLSKVEVSRTANVTANGKDAVTLTVTVVKADGSALADRTVTLEVTGEGNTLSPASGKTDGQGVMTASLVSTGVGSKRVTASVEVDGGPVVLGTRPTIEFVPPVAAKLAFGTASIQATAGAPLSPVLEVILQDADGNRASGNTGAVTLELATSPASAKLEGTLTVNAVDGVARFSEVVLKKAGTGYSLRASSGSLTAALSPTFAVVPAAPSVLELAGLPASMAAGGTANVQVTLKDAFGNLATNYTGTLHFSSTDSSAVLPGDAAFTAAEGGQKLFTGLSLKRSGSQQVRLTDTVNSALTASATVQVLAGPATKLVFTQQPGDHSVRAALGPVQVALTDAFGNVLALTAPSVTVAISPATALSGTTTVAPVDGLATFNNLSVAQEGSGYTLTATAGSLAPATSASFTIRDDVAPARPVLVQGTTTANSIVVQWVAVGDDGTLGTVTGQEMRFSTSDIVTDADFAAATLVTTGAPQAAGSNESITLTGLTPSSTYYVALKVTDNVGNSVRSVTLPVSTDNPVVTQMAFITQPVDGTAGTNLAAVRVALQDASGSTVTTATTAVTLNLINGPVFTPVTVPAVAGVATFSSLRVDTAGTGYKFQASAGSLPTKQSTAFNIQPAAADALELVGVSLPLTAGVQGTVQVTVRDAYGNVATGYTGTVHFTSSDPAAVLQSDTAFTPADMGIATFTAEMRTAGQQTLTVSGTGIATPDTLTWGIVEAASPDQLVFSVQPANGSVRSPLAAVAVQLRDAFGNPTAASSPTVTISLSGGSATAALSGTQNVDPASGVATFSDLSIDQEGTNFQLVAIAAGLTGATSTSFNITDGIAPAQAVISAAVASPTSARITWTAVGDDDVLGTAATYDLRYAPTPITSEAAFTAATRFTLPAPKPAGSAETAIVTGLDLSSEVYFALKVIDGAGNASSLSNSPKVGGDPCSGVVCTPPANSCSTNGRQVITYTSACVNQSGVGVCQDTPSPSTTCQSYETCSAGACVPVTPGSQAGRIIFSELNILGAEFIELRNTTGSDIDVHGFTLRNAAGVEVDLRAISDPNGTAGTPVTVPGNGVLYGIPNPSGAIPVGTGFVYGPPGTPFSISDTGDALALYAPSNGSLEDAVDFRSFVTNPDTPLTATNFVGFAGSSTQLDDAVATAAGNDTATNWCVSFYGHNVRGSRVTNTMGALNGSCKVAVINEALIDAPGGDDMKTFVEIAGPGGSIIGGAKITDVEGTGSPSGGLNQDGNLGTGETDGEFVIPAGKRIPADGILLVADSNAAVTATSVPGFVYGVDVLARDMDMEDGGGDAIQLVSATGTLLDTVGQDPTLTTWTNNTAYNGLALYEGSVAITPPNPSGTWATSMGRSPSSTDSDNNRNDFHIDPSPTPGQPNDTVNFTVASLTPDDGPNTAGAANVTVIGTDFAPSMKASFGTHVNTCVVNSSTQATCTALSNAAVTKVDVLFQNPVSVGSPDVLLTGAFTYTGKENETNSANEADYCNLQSPASFTVAKNTLTQVIYGQLYEAGVTDPAGAPAGWIAEVGYGTLGTDPTSNSSWRFFSASYNPGHTGDNNDEFMGSFTAPDVTASTDYSFTVRFSVDSGMRWTYCDLNGAGSNTGLTFEPTQLGVMTVTP